MSDGAAGSTGEGESRVEGEAGELLGLLSLDGLDDGVDLGRAGGSSAGSHCGRCCMGIQTNKRTERRLGRARAVRTGSDEGGMKLEVRRRREKT